MVCGIARIVEYPATHVTGTTYTHCTSSFRSKSTIHWQKKAMINRGCNLEECLLQPYRLSDIGRRDVWRR
ncbi:hypothetical protein HBI56_094200 [Parastagonospora nodorum]|nr:hypothetical protein HBH53_141230 [Parastagonospora nodorum]KAH3966190.1 hypothetical protein HBH51_144140 [Parastagonospora nodorum]KAH3989551.1 hypothetical protein HBH52_019140 [Parastagonospora nodorum]KAH3998181.1 hypothetical protein HBI10_132020 [Parastagonospora nodorum]KAH4030000.1 hypothetical protein HBI13_035580 [Parastagonospora nodorum]